VSSGTETPPAATAWDQRKLEAAIDQLRHVLRAAMLHRDRLEWQTEVTAPDGGRELAWIVYERRAMHNETNRIRSEAGLPYLPIEDIERAESLASGHIDYFQKFTLYCAELAVKP
jgi:hypothetical protein